MRLSLLESIAMFEAISKDMQLCMEGIASEGHNCAIGGTSHYFIRALRPLSQ
jgi:hypothetical protein